jgi:cytoskeletal protein CcmA (bactofilin family)
MRRFCLRSFVAAFATFVAGSLTIAHSAEIRSGDDVIIKANETIADDLYVFGRQITIDGTVEGDIVAIGNQITVNGVVKGHIMAAGQTVVIMGQAEGARIAGQVLKLGPQAKLDGDLLAAGLSLECVNDSQVLGDVLFAGYQALFAGRISDDIRGGMANCRLEGAVGGDINVEVGSNQDSPHPSSFGPAPPVAMPRVPGGLTIADSAEVEGDVTYSAPQVAKIDPQAKITGEVDHRRPQPKAKGGAAAPAQNKTLAKIFGRLRHLVSVLLVGVVALLLLPRTTAAWAETIRTRPAASLLSGSLGLLAFIALLVVAFVVIVFVAILLGVATLGELVPMVIVGGIVSYAALIVGFWLVAAFLAEALTGLAVGGIAFRDSSFVTRLAALLTGVFPIALLLNVPYLGGILGFIVLLFGLGSICLWLIGQAPTQSFAPLPAGKPVPATMVSKSGPLAP